MNGLVYIKTYGCQMNVYDSARILQILKPVGFEKSEFPEKADLILINTCSVREKPEKKLYSDLGRYRKLKEINPALIIGVCGCVSQQEKENLFNSMNAPDLIVGTDHIRMLPELIEQAGKNGSRIAGKWEFGRTENDFIEVDPSVEKSPSAFLTVMKGCNKVCSFCIVPYVRGPEVSKKSSQILKEARMLVSHGIREITLLGQNVNSYGRDREGEMNFSELLHAVSCVQGLYRLRFVTSHPVDCSPDLLECFGKIQKLCEYFHLPVQSGSDRILKKMRRGYTSDEYLRIIEKVRKIKPDISLSTDIIVGFPGETDEDFNDTVSLLKTAEFDQIFSFKYSKRPFTKASGLGSDVPEEIKSERLEKVHAVQDAITKRKMTEYKDRIVEVLVEGLSERSRGKENQWTGRTRSNFVVNFSLNQENIKLNAGDLLNVRIEKILPHSLKGRMI
jgi:tRNA-2-methylthio-N6-dimethylallyladenosine synthase